MLADMENGRFLTRNGRLHCPTTHQQNEIGDKNHH